MSNELCPMADYSVVYRFFMLTRFWTLLKKVDVTLITFLSTQSLQIKQKYSEFFGGPMGRFSGGRRRRIVSYTHLMAPRVSILI